ncbi:hypothetical protein BpHYR1_012864, partial [Brachionus plicatilis]
NPRIYVQKTFYDSKKLFEILFNNLTSLILYSVLTYGTGLISKSGLLPFIFNPSSLSLAKRVTEYIFYVFDDSGKQDEIPALYSSTSLRTNGTELISSALIYLSLNSQNRFEIVISERELRHGKE